MMMHLLLLNLHVLGRSPSASTSSITGLIRCVSVQCCAPQYAWNPHGSPGVPAPPGFEASLAAAGGAVRSSGRPSELATLS